MTFIIFIQFFFVASIYAMANRFGIPEYVWSLKTFGIR
jgi:hypothetical protein